MLPTEAATQIAVVAATVSGMRDVLYPAKGLAPKYPGMVIMLGQTHIDYFSTEQRWSFSVRGLLMTGLTTDTAKHIGEVDPFIAKLVDAFAPGTEAFHLRKSNGDQVDTCVLGEVEPSQEIGYAGLQHYGAVITWTVEMRRFNT